MDVLWFQQRRTRLVLVALNMLVALLTGFGAVQEFIVRGIRGREAQPFFIGLAGIAVSLLFITSGVAMWRKWPRARSLVIITAIFSILFHVFAALPPHRNVGFLALIMGAGYGLVLLIITFSSKGKKAEAAIS